MKYLSIIHLSNNLLYASHCMSRQTIVITTDLDNHLLI